MTLHTQVAARPHDVAQQMLEKMIASRSSPPQGAVTFHGRGSLPSAFCVSDLAASSIAAAGLAMADLLSAAGAQGRSVSVDRRLASFWFSFSLRPQGWEPPPPWDPIAGDYQTTDGWIRLHTNALHHRQAALSVLGVAEQKQEVAKAVAEYRADALEAAIVAAGGCAAKMRSSEEWSESEPGRSVGTEPLIGWEEMDEAPPPTIHLTGDKPLTGLRVLDLTRVLAGPVATRFLAFLGADVLRIDPPGWDEPGVVPEVMAGKRAARLDLGQTADRTRFIDLLSKADVLVHGYRPCALARLGFGEEVRRGIRPGLIDVSLDAYGWTGPWQGRRGFDSLVQMSCGIADAGMRFFGKQRPTPLPVQALDHATGYLMAFAALSGIAHRLRTGRSLRARLSLARTAKLLTEHPTAEKEREPAFAPERPEDVADDLEQTGWGLARRLLPPVTIDGLSLTSGTPAMPLGTHAANW